MAFLKQEKWVFVDEKLIIYFCDFSLSWPNVFILNQWYQKSWIGIYYVLGDMKTLFDFSLEVNDDTSVDLKFIGWYTNNDTH